MSEEMLIDLINMMVLLILTSLNISLCQNGKKGIWEIHLFFMIFIPLFIIDISSEIYFSFSSTLIYFLFVLNLYMDIKKLKYLFSEDYERKEGSEKIDE